MAKDDTNIGIPTAQNLSRSVDVQNFAEVIAELKAATAELQEVVVELKKIKTGTGLTIGVDLDEEVE